MPVKGVDLSHFKAQTVNISDIRAGVDEEGVGRVVEEKLQKFFDQVVLEKGVPAPPLRAVLLKLGAAEFSDADIPKLLEEKADELLYLTAQLARPINARPEFNAIRKQAMTLIAEGHLDAARAVVVRGRDAARQKATRDEAEYLAYEASIDSLQLAYDAAAEKYGEAASLVSSFDPIAMYYHLVQQAQVLDRSGRVDRAIEIARQALALIADIKLPESPDAAEKTNFLGVIFFNAGFMNEAHLTYQRALFSVGQDQLMRSTLYNNLGQTFQRLGDLVSARMHLETSVKIHRGIGNGSVVSGIALDNLGSVCAEHGDLDDAEKLHLEALQIFKSSGPFSTHLGTSLGNLSNIYLRKRDFEKAEAYRLRALDSHHRLYGVTGETLNDIANLIALYWNCGDEARSDMLINYLLSLNREMPSPADRYLAEMLRRLAVTALHTFRQTVAKRLATRAFELGVSGGPTADRA